MDSVSITIALALASISLGLSVVFALLALAAGIVSIYLTIKAIKISGGFAQKEDRYEVEDLLAKEIEANAKAVFLRIEKIEEQLQQRKKLEND